LGELEKRGFTTYSLPRVEAEVFVMERGLPAELQIRLAIAGIEDANTVERSSSPTVAIHACCSIARPLTAPALHSR
jgi:hypothetical protein